MGKPKSVGGLGLGDGPVALALTAMIFCLVAFLAITRRDVQHADARSQAGQGRRPVALAPERVD